MRALHEPYRSPQGANCFPFAPTALPAQETAGMHHSEMELTGPSCYHLRVSYTQTRMRGQHPSPTHLPHAEIEASDSPKNRAQMRCAKRSFVPQNFHRQETRCGPRRHQSRADRNAHRRNGNPHSIPRTGMKWHIWNCIHLRVQGDEMVVPSDKCKAVADEKSDQSPDSSNCRTLP